MNNQQELTGIHRQKKTKFTICFTIFSTKFLIMQRDYHLPFKELMYNNKVSFVPNYFPVECITEFDLFLPVGFYGVLWKCSRAPSVCNV